MNGRNGMFSVQDGHDGLYAKVYGHVINQTEIEVYTLNINEVMKFVHKSVTSSWHFLVICYQKKLFSFVL